MSGDAEQVLSMLAHASITQPDMVFVLGLTIRQVQAACEELRRAGQPVLSSGDGIKLAQTAEEALACAAALRRRAITQFLTARALRRTGLRMADQEATAQRMTLWGAA
jgi:thiamine pyrophosphate-dependent acetolactate synthase large subunit-like protein